MYKLTKSFKITDNFIGRYKSLIIEKVIPYQEDILNDKIKGIEKSNAITNFILAGEVIKSGTNDKAFYGMVFQDSDVAKWLEAAANALMTHPDPKLENRCDYLINIIGNAQEADGYLNTYFTLGAPERKWTNLQEAHELYCAGHMMEAAVAYAASTGKTHLLTIMSNMTDHIYDRFITQRRPGFPGHPEIELALLKMYRFTKDEKYLTLAQHFINVRGQDKNFFQKEALKRTWTVWGSNPSNPEYTQSNAPVIDQLDAVGHSVRAVYLYTGMADLAFETKNYVLKLACEKIWESITNKRMYVTGGIGSAYEGETFTADYHLPNDTAYSETCASIGLIFFANKMLKLEKKGIYADVMETALYNNVLAGMQLDGSSFFYVNPLEVIPGISGTSPSHKHALPERPQWFACACCPPNISRLVTSIAEYAWDQKGKIVYNHLFIGGELALQQGIGGMLSLETEYPYNNELTYHFTPDGNEMDMTLAIRIPAYSKESFIELNNKIITPFTKDGYAYIEGPFDKDTNLKITLSMSVRRIYANSKVGHISNQVAIKRGPLVYCVEGVDNANNILGLRLTSDSEFTLIREAALYGITSIKANGLKRKESKILYSSTPPSYEPYDIKFIPYYAWSNRGLNEMRVWIPEIIDFRADK